MRWSRRSGTASLSSAARTKRSSACAGAGKLQTPKGAVEIAYGIAPGFQGRGLATEAAQALVKRAFLRDDVKTVIAHTLREHNASTRVLTKCGFERTGEAMDPDEGVVWKWALAR